MIHIFKGDDTNFNNDKFVTINLITDLPLTGWGATFELQGFKQEFTDITSKVLEVVIPSASTSAMFNGDSNAKITLSDSDQRLKTISNDIPFNVSSKVQANQPDIIPIDVLEGEGIIVQLEIPSSGGGTGDVTKAYVDAQDALLRTSINNVASDVDDLVIVVDGKQEKLTAEQNTNINDIPQVKNDITSIQADLLGKQTAIDLLDVRVGDNKTEINNLGDGIESLDSAIEGLTNTKQDKLIAGANITIIDNVISSTGGGSGGGAVDSVNGQTGVVVLDKADIGLSNVDNTSDLNKPISTATQTALNGKQPTGNYALKSELPDTSSFATKTELNAKADKSAIPTQTSQLANDSNFVVDSNYVHTDNNFTTAEKNKLSGLSNYDDEAVRGLITQNEAAIIGLQSDKQDKATETSLTTASATITAQDNTDYTATVPLTSLTISSMTGSGSITFEIGVGFVFNPPSGAVWVGSQPSYTAGRMCVIVYKNGLLVGGVEA